MGHTDIPEVAKAADDLVGDVESEQESEQEIETEPYVVTRVGGDYEVTEVNKTAGGFETVFEAKTKTGSADTIVLSSAHVHMSVEKGKTLRISAEIARHHRDANQTLPAAVEARQVLVFLPAPEGYLPVWLLSRRSMGFEKGPTNYLKMHSPQSDYLVF